MFDLIDFLRLLSDGLPNSVLRERDKSICNRIKLQNDTGNFAKNY